MRCAGSRKGPFFEEDSTIRRKGFFVLPANNSLPPLSSVTPSFLGAHAGLPDPLALREGAMAEPVAVGSQIQPRNLYQNKPSVSCSVSSFPRMAFQSGSNSRKPSH